MRLNKTVMSAIVGIGLAAAMGTAPSATAATPHSAVTPHSAATAQHFTGAKENAKSNKAFLDAVLKSVAKKRAANPDARSVTITYNASGAPSFAGEISQSRNIWNSSVSNVKLQATTGSADFDYYEGNDPEGSYASTDGHGHGYILIDYSQADEYNPTRIVAHETGHVLGLPDHYSGPCSELMSGGGPGPSCTNARPNSTEISRVNSLWVNGLAKALAKLG